MNRLALALVAVATCAAEIPFEVHDMAIGDTARARGVQVRLLGVEETKDPIVGAIRRAEVMLSVDGETVRLECGNYELPRTTGPVQLDCPNRSPHGRNRPRSAPTRTRPTVSHASYYAPFEDLHQRENR